MKKKVSKKKTTSINGPKRKKNQPGKLMFKIFTNNKPVSLSRRVTSSDINILKKETNGLIVTVQPKTDDGSKVERRLYHTKTPSYLLVLI